MARYEEIDLQQLPAPLVIKTIDYDTIRQERLVNLKDRLTAAGIPYNVEELESDPNVILVEEDTYRETLDLEAINDAARAVLLPFAQGADLDNLAAFYGITRNAGELDDDFRIRIQNAPEGLAQGLTGGGYAHLAQLGRPSIKTVATIKRGGGRIDLILQGYGADGTVEPAVVNDVQLQLMGDEGAQLTDIVNTTSAKPLYYDIAFTLHVPRGPSPTILQTLAETQTGAMGAALAVIGGTVPLDAIIAAGRVPSTIKMVVTSPPADVIAGAREVPIMRKLTVTIEQPKLVRS